MAELQQSCRSERERPPTARAAAHGARGNVKVPGMEQLRSSPLSLDTMNLLDRSAAIAEDGSAEQSGATTRRAAIDQAASTASGAAAAKSARSRPGTCKAELQKSGGLALLPHANLSV